MYAQMQVVSNDLMCFWRSVGHITQNLIMLDRLSISIAIISGGNTYSVVHSRINVAEWQGVNVTLELCHLLEVNRISCKARWRSCLQPAEFESRSTKRLGQSNRWSLIHPSSGKPLQT